MSEKSKRQQLKNLKDISARRRAMTHCYRGHELTPENTIIKKGNRRQCRICARDAHFYWREKMQRILKLDRKHRFHGTTTGAAIGCKCVRCKLAKNAASRERRKRKKNREIGS